MTVTFPRPDYAHDLEDVRAWLTDDERDALTAINCPDLATTVETHVRLHEHDKRGSDGRRRVPSRYKWTPEQTARASEASNLLEAHQRAFLSPDYWIHRIAAARRDAHLARTT